MIKYFNIPFINLYVISTSAHEIATNYPPVHIRTSFQSFTEFVVFLSVVSTWHVVMPSRSGQRRILTRRKGRQDLCNQLNHSIRLTKATREQMVSAIEAVKSSKGINRAAMDHGIPRSTFKRQTSCPCQRWYLSWTTTIFNVWRKKGAGYIFSRLRCSWF